MSCPRDISDDKFVIHMSLNAVALFPSPSVMYLIVPKQGLGESPLSCKHVTRFSSTIKPLLLLEAKVICNIQERTINDVMHKNSLIQLPPKQ